MPCIDQYTTLLADNRDLAGCLEPWLSARRTWIATSMHPNSHTGAGPDVETPWGDATRHGAHALLLLLLLLEPRCVPSAVHHRPRLPSTICMTGCCQSVASRHHRGLLAAHRRARGLTSCCLLWLHACCDASNPPHHRHLLQYEGHCNHWVATTVPPQYDIQHARRHSAQPPTRLASD
jgi:hypothetical protein